MAVQSEKIGHADLVGGGETDLHSHAGGNGGSIDKFCATKNGDYDIPGDTSWHDVPTWTQVVADSPFSFNTSTGELTFLEAGWYDVSFCLTLDQRQGSNRTTGAARFNFNSGALAGTEQRGYHRNTSDGTSAYSSRRLIQVTNGDVLKIEVRNEESNYYQRVLGVSGSFMVIKIG